MLFAAIVAVAATACAADAPRDGGLGDETEASDPAEPYGPPHVIGRIQERSLAELSGLEASSQNPGVMWAHNDSGGDAVVYCLRLSGSPCGTVRIEGAAIIDWEDIALGPGPNGDPSLFIGDIGDNALARRSITIYRVAEPEVREGADGSVQADAFRFTYPVRPHDAEGLIVHPETGDVYVITKSFSRRTDVFVARAPLADGSLDEVATIDIDAVVPAVTGADVTARGDRVILSTYAVAHELRLSEGGRFDDIWTSETAPIDLGRHKQNEAVTYDASDTRIVSSSEGKRAPILAVERRG